MNRIHKWNESPEKTDALNMFFSMIRPTKTFNCKRSEYGIKHIYEQYGRKVLNIPDTTDLYVYSEEFIHHAIENGFKFKMIKTTRSGEISGKLNMSETDIRAIIKKTE